MRRTAALCALGVWFSGSVALAQPEPAPAAPPTSAPPTAPPTAALPPVAAQPAAPPPPAAATPPTAAAPYPAYGEPPPAPPPGQPYGDPPAYPEPPPSGRSPREGVETHDGFYLRFGIGGGSMSSKLTYDPDTASPEATLGGTAAALHLMLGGTVAKGFVIGAALGVATVSDPDVEAAGTTSTAKNTNVSLSHLGLLLDWFPDDHGGFHVGGSLGLYTLVIDRPFQLWADQSNPDQDETLSGGGGQLFVGYDFWVGDDWSLGGLLSLTHASTEDESGDVKTMGSTNAWTLQFSALYH